MTTSNSNKFERLPVTTAKLQRRSFLLSTGAALAGLGSYKRAWSSRSIHRIYLGDPPFKVLVDTTQDYTSAIQGAIDSLAAEGGGIIDVPVGQILIQNIRLKPGVSLIGGGGHYHGFTKEGKNSTLRIIPDAPSSAVTGVQIADSGSGYATAPKVEFVGGGGRGAQAISYVARGKVSGIRVIDPGAGYKSPPDVQFSGGGGSGGSAVAHVSSTILYSTGASVDFITISGINFQGHSQTRTEQYASDVGLLLHKSIRSRIYFCHFYNFQAEALYLMQGGTLRIRDCDIFGLFRRSKETGDLYPSGALHLAGDDNYVEACEIGSTASGDSQNLPNAALYYSGSALMASNSVFELSDVGTRIVGQSGAFVNCRADLNFGHGWWLRRDIEGVSPPQGTRMLSCWGHRNGRYKSNSYDNFRIEPNNEIRDTQAANIKSDFYVKDGWVHRHGFFDGGTGTQLIGFKDAGSGTAWWSGVSGAVGPIQSVDPKLFLLPDGVTTIDFAGRANCRVSNTLATVITEFTGGFEGQEVSIHSTNRNTIVAIRRTTAESQYLPEDSERLEPYRIYFFNLLGGNWLRSLR